MRKDSNDIKNYITPAGLRRLQDERRFLVVKERPAVTQVVQWAASNGDRSENADYQYGKRRLRQIDSRIRFLTKRIEAAEVVDPKAPRNGERATRVFFGATVTYEDGDGERRVVTSQRTARSSNRRVSRKTSVCAEVGTSLSSASTAAQMSRRP